MKKVAGSLKLDMAQFRELEAFAKFGSDLDASTMKIIENGRRNVEILKQDQYQPMSVGKEIAILYVGSKGLLTSVPVDRVKEFEEMFLMTMENKHQDILDTLASGKLTDEAIETIESVTKDLIGNFKA
jgi:F-type H+-transporting ATPase subunit alpha